MGVIAIRDPSPPPAADADAFEAMYHATGAAVLGYALRRSSNRDDALDAVAATFTVAWRRRLDIPTDGEAIRPWLFGIARRCLADTQRSSDRASRLGAKLAAGFTEGTVPDPASAVQASADAVVVRQAMNQLSNADRELLSLIAWEGLTPAQAAVALDLTPAAARVRLHRARTRLKDALSATTQLEEDDHDH